jgi:ketosteroid isomerase-like protein
MAGQKVRAAVNAELARFNLAIRLRDISIVEHFHKAAIFIGSEAGELAHGRDAIAALLAALFKAPYTVQFDWKSVEAARSGDTAWFLADGEVVISSAEGEKRRLYGLTGVLVESKRGWRWRMFHGSEPFPN